MSRRSRGLLLVLGLVASTVACQRAAPRHAVLTVEGMHCDSCSAAITTELERLDGVTAASADWRAGRAEADFDASRLAESDLEKAVEGLGYTVTSIEVAGGARR